MADTAEAFFASLPADQLNEKETILLSLLESLLTVLEALPTAAHSLLQGNVTLQEWAFRRISREKMQRLRCSGFVWELIDGPYLKASRKLEPLPVPVGIAPVLDECLSPKFPNDAWLSPTATPDAGPWKIPEKDEAECDKCTSLKNTGLLRRASVPVEFEDAENAFEVERGQPVPSPVISGDSKKQVQNETSVNSEYHRRLSLPNMYLDTSAPHPDQLLSKGRRSSKESSNSIRSISMEERDAKWQIAPEPKDRPDSEYPRRRSLPNLYLDTSAPHPDQLLSKGRRSSNESSNSIRSISMEARDAKWQIIAPEPKDQSDSEYPRRRSEPNIYLDTSTPHYQAATPFSAWNVNAISQSLEEQFKLEDARQRRKNSKSSSIVGRSSSRTSDSKGSKKTTLLIHPSFHPSLWTLDK